VFKGVIGSETIRSINLFHLLFLYIFMIKNPNPLNVNEPKLGMQITQRKILAEVVNNKTVENAKITDICFNNSKYKT
jgi:hypothetical protein